MWDSWQFFAVWLILVGVVCGSVARSRYRSFRSHRDATAEFREQRRHARARRRRMRSRIQRPLHA